MLRTTTKAAFLFFFLSLLLNSSASGDLLVNGDFEAPSGFGLGQQGAMPPNWVVTNVTPDLYSSNGSFGLPASFLGNFSGVSANQGLGWVAGWSLQQESFAQNLATTLTPGAEYSIGGYLLQAKRADLDNPGGYAILLNNANSFSGPLVQVAIWQPTTNSNSWEYRNATFTAPANASSLTWIIFRPYHNSGTGAAYPGLDNVSLTAVPEPSSLAFFGIGMAAFAARRRKLIGV